MRLFFPNLNRPKKAAKRIITTITGLRLADSQRLVAVASGYQDWHDLEKHHASQPASEPDESLAPDEFRCRAVEMINAMSSVSDAMVGDLQYALSLSRLAGNRRWRLPDHQAVRLDLWRAAGALGPGQGRTPGTVLRIANVGSVSV